MHSYYFLILVYYQKILKKLICLNNFFYKKYERNLHKLDSYIKYMDTCKRCPYCEIYSNEDNYIGAICNYCVDELHDGCDCNTIAPDYFIADNYIFFECENKKSVLLSEETISNINNIHYGKLMQKPNLKANSLSIPRISKLTEKQCVLALYMAQKYINRVKVYININIEKLFDTKQQIHIFENIYDIHFCKLCCDPFISIFDIGSYCTSCIENYHNKRCDCNNYKFHTMQHSYIHIHCNNCFNVNKREIKNSFK